MLAPIVYLSTPSETATYQLAPVGTIRAYDHPDLGYQLLRSVKATSAITANEVVKYDDGSSETAVKSTGASHPANLIAGLAVSDIAAGSYGWVVCSGQAYAVLLTTAGNGSTLQSGSTAGMVDDVAVSTVEHCVLGTLVDITGSDGVAWATTSYATRKVIMRVNSLL